MKVLLVNTPYHPHVVGVAVAAVVSDQVVGPRLGQRHHRIERMIGHLKVNRAVATRYDKLARSFLDVLHIATIRRCLRLATL